MFRSNVVFLTDITFSNEFNFLKSASNFLTIHFEENNVVTFICIDLLF